MHCLSVYCLDVIFYCLLSGVLWLCVDICCVVVCIVEGCLFEMS